MLTFDGRIRLGAVAPRAGAWIETHFMVQYAEDDAVAPRAGAWIETTKCLEERWNYASRSPRGSVD